MKTENIKTIQRDLNIKLSLHFSEYGLDMLAYNVPNLIPKGKAANYFDTFSYYDI